jgi:hypothetical protein
MGTVRSAHVGDEKCIKLNPRHGWKDNTKMNHTETSCELDSSGLGYGHRGRPS